MRTIWRIALLYPHSNPLLSSDMPRVLVAVRLALHPAITHILILEIVLDVVWRNVFEVLIILRASPVQLYVLYQAQ